MTRAGTWVTIGAMTPLRIPLALAQAAGLAALALGLLAMAGYGPGGALLAFALFVLAVIALLGVFQAAHAELDQRAWARLANLPAPAQREIHAAALAGDATAVQRLLRSHGVPRAHALTIAQRIDGIMPEGTTAP